MPFVTGPLPQRLKLVHGFGAVAFGVKDSGFSFFLLPFYNLVLGVDASTVGAALATALLIDAIVDPLIGNLSDRTYTRWGRRLPWLYLAPWPLALLWTVLWSPPFTGTPGFWEIVALAVGVRLLLSACEVPSVSLVPEITDDYDDRTTLFRYRFLSGWLGGLLMMVLAFTVFLPTPASQLEPEGYASYGMFGAALMALAVIGSAAAQHHIVAQLPARRPPPFSIRGAFAEIFDAFREKAFVIFALGGLAAYVLQGMTFSITQYVNLYVWQFSELAFQLYPVALFLSVVLMFVIVGPLHRRWGKPKSAAIGALVGLVFYCGPYALYLAGAWPTPPCGASSSPTRTTSRRATPSSSCSTRATLTSSSSPPRCRWRSSTPSSCTSPRRRPTTSRDSSPCSRLCTTRTCARRRPSRSGPPTPGPRGSSASTPRRARRCGSRPSPSSSGSRRATTTTTTTSDDATRRDFS